MNNSNEEEEKVPINRFNSSVVQNPIEELQPGSFEPDNINNRTEQHFLNERFNQFLPGNSLDMSSSSSNEEVNYGEERGGMGF